MKPRELTELIRVEFVQLMQMKPGWGRNEVIAAYDRAVSLGLAVCFDLDPEDLTRSVPDPNHDSDPPFDI